MNGRRLNATDDQAHDVILSIADGALDTVPAIAAELARLVEPS